MNFREDAKRIITSIYDSDTEDPLTDCDNALHKEFDNAEQKTIFIQEYLEDLTPKIVETHLNWLAEQDLIDFYLLTLFDYNVFNIVAIVKRKRGKNDN